MDELRGWWKKKFAKNKDEKKDSNTTVSSDQEVIHTDDGTAWQLKKKRLSSTARAGSVSGDPPTDILVESDGSIGSSSESTYLSSPTSQNGSMTALSVPSQVLTLQVETEQDRLDREEREEQARQKQERRKAKLKSRVAQFNAILNDPDEFSQLLRFLGKYQQQEVIFICEVQQLLNSQETLDRKSVAAQIHKIVSLFLSDSELPCYIAKSLSPITCQQLLQYVTPDQGESDQGSLSESMTLKRGTDEVEVEVDPMIETDTDRNENIQDNDELSDKDIANTQMLDDEGSSDTEKNDTINGHLNDDTAHDESNAEIPSLDQSASDCVHAEDPEVPTASISSPKDADSKANDFELISTRAAFKYLSDALHEVEIGLVKNHLSAYLDYRDGKTSELGRDVHMKGIEYEDEIFELDDVLSDTGCYRSFLLFLLETQRYELLLFWQRISCLEDFEKFVGSGVLLSKIESSSDGKLPASQADVPNMKKLLRTCREIERRFFTGLGAPEFMTAMRTTTIEAISNESVNNLIIKVQDSNRQTSILINELRQLIHLMHVIQTKAERLLRFQYWPAFCESPHFDALLTLRRAAATETLVDNDDGDSSSDEAISKPRTHRSRLGNMARSLISYLKQQPITQEMTIIDCADQQLVEHRLKSRKIECGHLPPGSRILDAVCVFALNMVPEKMSPQQPSSPGRLPKPPPPPRVVPSVELLFRTSTKNSSGFQLPPVNHLGQLCFPYSLGSDTSCDCSIRAKSQWASEQAGARQMAAVTSEYASSTVLDSWGFPVQIDHKGTLSQDDTFVSGNFDLLNFVLTTVDGTRIYGASLRIESKNSKTTKLYSVCILSSLPLLTRLRSTLAELKIAEANSVSEIIEDSTFKRIVKLTSPLKDTSSVFGVDSDQLSCPEISEQLALDIPVKDFSFSTIFSFLHPDRVIRIIEALVLEKKVLLMSNQFSLLTVIGESLRALLYPFKWNYLFIPILPEPMFQYLACPTPFLVGIHKCCKPSAIQLLESTTDLLVVDLDLDSATWMGNVFVNELNVSFPQAFRNILLQQLCDIYPSASCRPSQSANLSVPSREDHQQDWRCQQVFLKFWSSLMCGYRDYCIFLPDFADPSLIFHSPSFLDSNILAQSKARSRIRNLYPPYVPKLQTGSSHSFLDKLLQTTYFPVFLYERTYPDGLNSLSDEDRKDNRLIDAFDFFEEVCLRTREQMFRPKEDLELHLSDGIGTNPFGGLEYSLRYCNSKLLENLLGIEDVAFQCDE